MHVDEEHEQQIGRVDTRQLPEWLAVLSSQGIDYKLVPDQDAWRVLVPRDSAALAGAELEAYAEDERRRAAAAAARIHSEPALHASWSPWWVAAMMLTGYLRLGAYDAGNLYLQRAVLDRQAVFARHEWWRVITALWVHGGDVHLLGNLLGLLVLGWAVCGVFGGGLGWALILTAGAAGNAAAGFYQSPHTVSFGASTAVFGALGILAVRQSVMQARRGGLSWSVWNRAWVPLGAGLAVLTLLGTGPQSNLAAHLFGFFSGIILALPFSLARRPRWYGPGIQVMLQAACLLIVTLAWRRVMR